MPLSELLYGVLLVFAGSVAFYASYALRGGRFGASFLYIGLGILAMILARLAPEPGEWIQVVAGALLLIGSIAAAAAAARLHPHE